MRWIFLLALRYIAHNKLKTVLLVACVSLTFLLPFAVHLLANHYNRDLVARAASTPLIVGAKGSRVDLVLNAIYFRTVTPDPINMREVDKIRESGIALPIPMYCAYTARDFPIVGTNIDYFAFRNLKVRQGSLPVFLGDAVVGAGVARALALRPDGHLLSDQRNLYDISKTYPLRMHITGILEESHSPDDYAVFVDVKTTWIIDGIGHGHEDVVKNTRDVLVREQGNVIAKPSIVEYMEVSQDNIQSFHFHGDPRDYPLSAVIALPRDAKSGTILKARYAQAGTVQMVSPLGVIEEMMGILFKIQRFLDANYIVILLSTLLFLILVITLSLRIRQRERQTMHKIGCRRLTVFWLQAAELLIILVLSLGCAGIASLCLMVFAPDLFRML